MGESWFLTFCTVVGFITLIVVVSGLIGLVLIACNHSYADGDWDITGFIVGIAVLALVVIAGITTVIYQDRPANPPTQEQTDA